MYRSIRIEKEKKIFEIKSVHIVSLPSAKSKNIYISHVPSSTSTIVHQKKKNRVIFTSTEISQASHGHLPSPSRAKSYPRKETSESISTASERKRKKERKKKSDEKANTRVTWSKEELFAVQRQFQGSFLSSDETVAPPSDNRETQWNETSHLFYLLDPLHFPSLPLFIEFHSPSSGTNDSVCPRLDWTALSLPRGPSSPSSPSAILHDRGTRRARSMERGHIRGHTEHRAVSRGSRGRDPGESCPRKISVCSIDKRLW